MTSIEARASTQTKRATRSPSAKSRKANASSKSPSAIAARETTEDLHAARVTKHDRILTLLTRREGASILEMMETSGWQQHSVRGFLAGTVKKKLGLDLTSAKMRNPVQSGQRLRWKADTQMVIADSR